MTREEAIQYAKDKFDKGLYRLELGYLNRGLYQIVAREVDFMRVAIAALREQDDHFREATKKVGHKWTSVEERLPEDGVDVLTRRAVGMSVEAHCGWGWTEDGYHTKWRVTHWMPLPEPPKEDT